MKDLSVQWLTSDPGLLELDWLQGLMPSQIPQVQVHQHPDQVDVSPRALLITNSVSGYRSVLQRFGSSESRYGVILLSDEFVQDSCEWLADVNCSFVARHYLHPALVSHPKAMTFGLGYTRGFASQPQLFKPLEQRGLLWCFAGTPHGKRIDAVRLFSRLEPFRVHGCRGFMSSDCLPIHDYAALLGNSVFSLCPPGHSSNDTYRLYESLEAGCIPVVLANSSQYTVSPSYWHAIFPAGLKLPFVIGHDYADCFTQVCQLIQAGAISDVWKSCGEFWMQCKSLWREQLAFRLSNLSAS